MNGRVQAFKQFNRDAQFKSFAGKRQFKVQSDSNCVGIFEDHDAVTLTQFRCL